MTSFSTLFVCFGGVLVVACGSSDTKRNVRASSDAGTDADRGGATGSGGATGTGGASGAGGARGGAGGSLPGTGGARVADAALDSSTDATTEAGCTVPALHFGTDADTVAVPSSTSMDFGASGTLEVWLFADLGPDGGLSVSGVLFNKWANFQEDKFLGVASNGEVNVYLHTSSGPIVNFNSTPTVTPGHWTHVALAYDATSTRAYVDGTKVGEALGASVPANAAGDVQIGHVARDFVERAVHGFYSEMRLSKVARYVANFTPAKHLTTDTDTTAFWKFDEGTGTTIADSSGNTNAGTITGATWLPAPCR
jgi:hypothetical protein